MGHFKWLCHDSILRVQSFGGNFVRKGKAHPTETKPQMYATCWQGSL